MNIKKVISDIKADKKTAAIIIVGILGIFLLLISNYSDNENIDSNEDKVIEAETQTVTADEIEKKLEERLSEVISSVKGAGNAHVMVTVASVGEYVYAENKKYDTDTDSSSTDSEIVIFERDENDAGLVITVKSPDVLGVAVICEGGDSAVIKSEIINLVTSLFGIGSDRVYVGSKAVK